MSEVSNSAQGGGVMLPNPYSPHKTPRYVAGRKPSSRSAPGRRPSRCHSTSASLGYETGVQRGRGDEREAATLARWPSGSPAPRAARPPTLSRHARRCAGRRTARSRSNMAGSPASCWSGGAEPSMVCGRAGCSTRSLWATSGHPGGMAADRHAGRRQDRERVGASRPSTSR